MSIGINCLTVAAGLYSNKSYRKFFWTEVFDGKNLRRWKYDYVIGNIIKGFDD